MILAAIYGVIFVVSFWLLWGANRDRLAVVNHVSATCDAFAELCEKKELTFPDAAMAHENAFSQHANVIQRMEQRESTATLMSIACTVFGMMLIYLEKPVGDGSVLLVDYLIPKLGVVAAGPVVALINAWLFLNPARRVLQRDKARAWEVVLERPGVNDGVNPRQMKATKDMSRSLVRAARDMQEAARETKANSQECLATLNSTAQTMSKTVRQVTALGSETHRAIQQQLEGVASSLAKCLELEFEKGGVKLEKKIDALDGHLKRRASQLLDKLDATTGRYDNILENVEGFEFDGLKKKIEDEAEGLNRQLKEIVQSLAKQTADISRMQRGQLKETQELSERLASLAGKMKEKTRGQVRTVGEALEAIASIVKEQESTIHDMLRRAEAEYRKFRWYRPTTWFR